MNYQVGETVRGVVIRFDDGDNILEGLCEIAKKENRPFMDYGAYGNLFKLKPKLCVNL